MGKEHPVGALTSPGYKEGGVSGEVWALSTTL